MSTKLHDFARNAILNVGLTPRIATATVTGPGGDLIAGDGRCFAVQQVGNLTGTGASITMEIQDQFWGDRTFTVTDPEGYVLTFAQTVRAFDPSQPMPATA